MARWSRLIAPELVHFAGVRDGDSVLDVGAGTGELSAAVAAAVRGGQIVGVDASPDYVAYAAKTRLCDGRLRFEVGDATQLAFADATFDKALSALVLNFVPDPGRAVREMTRVTKPGGVVSAAVWDYADGMKMLRVFWDEAIALRPSAHSRDEANMPLCKRGELAALLREEGLADVSETELTVTLSFADFSDYWEPFLFGQGPAGAYVVSLSEAERGALQARLRERLAAGLDGHPFDLTARAWAAKGTTSRRP